MPCKNPPPCPQNYRYYKLANGKRCCRKIKSVEALKTKFQLADAKKKLRVLYAMDVGGKIRSPAFISKLTGVNGRNGAEKIANIRRTLSTCKKMGIPIVSSNGKKFKTYRTLVNQCKVSFKKTPSGVHLSNLISKFKKRKAQNPLHEPLLSGDEHVEYAPLGEQPDFIDLSALGEYVPPPMVSDFGRYKRYGKARSMGFGKKRRSSGMEFGSSCKGSAYDMEFGSSCKGSASGMEFGKKRKSAYGMGFGKKRRSSGMEFGSSCKGSASGMEFGSSCKGSASGMEFGKKRRSSGMEFGSSCKGSASGMEFGSSCKGSASGMEFGRKRKVSKKAVKIPKNILKMCKKLKIKVSVKRGPKRVYKKLSVLKKQIKRKLKMMKKKQR
jgi:hypothetical protein